MSMERIPELGTKPVILSVKLPPSALDLEEPSRLADGLREFYRTGDFADVALICAGQTFLAHKAILASQSAVLREGLLAGESSPSVGGRQEVRLAEIANPEAVRFMLDFMYQTDSTVLQEYNPRTQDVNKDVLRLARSFRLPGLTGKAVQWLSKDLTTANVLERLAICKEFELHTLREQIIEQLTTNGSALQEVANSEQLMQQPELMQELLQQAARASASVSEQMSRSSSSGTTSMMTTRAGAKKKPRNT